MMFFPWLVEEATIFWCTTPTALTIRYYCETSRLVCTTPTTLPLRLANCSSPYPQRTRALPHTLPFTTLQQFTIVFQGWLQTESTKTGCVDTLSQERRIKHACLMLQPPLLQLSVARDLLTQQEVVLDQDGRLLLPSPSLCRPGCGKRLCGGCCRVSWKLQHIFRSLEMSIT